MSVLPTGTVTLLFTDIEGSTRLWEQHPDEMASALARHDVLLRSAIESAGGHVFKTVGDSFCAVFAAARDAVAAAGSAQGALWAESWPPSAVLKVRMALHTGECEERDGDYFGPAVNRVARLEATAHGGQVVVSRSTAEVLGDRPPAGTQLVKLGSHSLRDLERPEEIFQLVINGVSASFPPLRAHRNDDLVAERPEPTNLTRTASSFVGREREMAQVEGLLQASRLVTLAGSGGVGKTRLAIEVGLSLVASNSEGVWLVELASLADATLVASSVLDDLGIVAQPGQEPLESLLKVLADQERLVILDNCEHLLDEVAVVADAMLRRCAKIRIIATSREPLRIDGEVIYRVPALSLPPADAREVRDLENSGAVALFAERAAAQVPGFEITDSVATLVASICRRLDGMPLALELATARLRSMSLAKLHERLEHRFDLLTGGSRVALPRQQTLAALVDWSFELLSEPERAVFRRSAVFVDGFDLEAVEYVCALDDISVHEIADHLASLVDKSMIATEAHGDDLRYRLQETLHEYASERLADSATDTGTASEADRVADAHRDFFLELATRAEIHLFGRSVRAWLQRLDAEDSNLRTAVERALGTQEGAKRVLEQFWAARRFWRDVQRPSQVLMFLDQALELVGSEISASGRARALSFRAMIFWNIDRRQEMQAWEVALVATREANDVSLEADGLSRYARILNLNGRMQEAASMSAQALALARGTNDPILLGSVLLEHASTLLLAGDPGAEARFLEGLALVEQTGDDATAASLHNNYALVRLELGEVEVARHHLERCLQLRGEQLNLRSLVEYSNLGWMLLLEGDPQRAQLLLQDCLRTCRLAGGLSHLPYIVLPLACCAHQLDSSERAAVLLGASDALLTAEAWESFEASIRERYLALVRETVGADFDALYSQGLTQTADETFRMVLSPR
jgi:predicted ATPase/class 3 adenylate cyclase